jgi:hypothetical protein
VAILFLYDMYQISSSLCVIFSFLNFLNADAPGIDRLLFIMILFIIARLINCFYGCSAITYARETVPPLGGSNSSSIFTVDPTASNS